MDRRAACSWSCESSWLLSRQRPLAEHNEPNLQVHVGLNAAEPVAGEVLVSDTVRGLARTSAGVGFEDRGEQTLKGFDEPVRLYEVRWRE